jgi:hypothetical protein
LRLKRLAIFDHLRHGPNRKLCPAGRVRPARARWRGSARKPIEERKRRLAHLLRDAGRGPQLNQHLDELGHLVFRHACELGLEGIVSKRRGSRYQSGSSSHWVKTKNPNAPAAAREAEEEWGIAAMTEKKRRTPRILSSRVSSVVLLFVWAA